MQIIIYVVYCECYFDEYSIDYVRSFANENDAKKYVKEMNTSNNNSTTYYYEQDILY